ncbi:hypothetical protein Q3G72_025075 [Acer saccharum]|nr:hypothetical protein Q3G72_025075 [Acer saccharum]
MEEWDVPDEVQTRVVLPPKGRKPRGRPTKKRKPSKGEEIVQRKCGRCGGMGHNRQKCGWMARDVGYGSRCGYCCFSYASSNYNVYLLCNASVV